MKLVRFGDAGREKPGLVDAEGNIRDLSGHVAELAGDALDPGALGKLAGIDPETLPLAPPGARLGAPVARVGNFIGIGLNYADHAAEAGRDIPTEPVLFNKAPSCIAGPHDAVTLPPETTRADWEVELAVVIGRRTHLVPEAEALDCVAGYCLCNDISERAFQSQSGGQWTKGKSSPGFGPLGPWLVTPDELGDPQNVSLWLDVNGQRMQDGTTSLMIFGVAHLVHYVSKFMLLEPGDVITTGTPSGVGNGRKPPVCLKAGDVMELGGSGLGRQRQVVG